MSEQTKEAVQVGALAAAAPPSIELAVQSPISAALQTVQDENGNNTGLSLASNAAQVTGKDVPGLAPLPLTIAGTAAGTGSPASWGRVLRVTTGQASSPFFDIGIDAAGNFFINGPGSTATVHVLAIPSGGMKPASSAPPTANLEAVFVDTKTGILYYQ